MFTLHTGFEVLLEMDRRTLSTLVSRSNHRAHSSSGSRTGYTNYHMAVLGKDGKYTLRKSFSRHTTHKHVKSVSRGTI